jgi:hypothetical protein
LQQGQVLPLDELCPAFPLTGEAQLIIRAVLLRGVGLATTTRFATDVILLRQKAGLQVGAEPGDLLFDLGDLSFHAPAIGHERLCGLVIRTSSIVREDARRQFTVCRRTAQITSGEGPLRDMSVSLIVDKWCENSCDSVSPHRIRLSLALLA